MSKTERIAEALNDGAEILFLDAERAAHMDGDLAPHYRAWECAMACREAAALLRAEPAGLRKEWNQASGRDGLKYVEGWNAALDAVAALLRAETVEEPPKVYWLDTAWTKAVKYYVKHNATSECKCAGCKDLRAALDAWVARKREPVGDAESEQARYFRESYGDLKAAIEQHLGRFIIEDDVAEIAILCEAVESAGKACAEPVGEPVGEKPRKCGRCGKWFVPNPAMRNVSCCVLHAPGTCCHYSDTEVPAPPAAPEAQEPEPHHTDIGTVTMLVQSLSVEDKRILYENLWDYLYDRVPPVSAAGSLGDAAAWDNSVEQIHRELAGEVPLPSAAGEEERDG